MKVQEWHESRSLGKYRMGEGAAYTTFKLFRGYIVGGKHFDREDFPSYKACKEAAEGYAAFQG